ncbi:hypothetical protein [Pseudoteredinibacter isoporae]|uniref:DNA-binding HxlR family transcriptional regulator n=1 Tax=Pseudoteredinibacter isoporae TaxID=570281 RepID=A0A7X0JYE0_9GAMM|nr:hypothetical protein [Pseudoteredinibacter isoporae]MBB6523840.1 DNA-binding HxlR family transcriptional regulator [Pseudoteredinibacter isoporae]NHO89358.1 hypothetical protein [Pseudoteredinibacter isoporae]NIB22465.1 hypothetical protein [Pseudoteredinibacter isoporae]
MPGYLYCNGTLTKTNKNVVKCSGTLQTITESELVSKVVEQVPPPFPELEATELAAIMAATATFLAVCWMGKNFMGLLKNTKTE